MSESHHDEGFTLVELLVTLSILALLVVYALSALSSMRQMNAVAERVEKQQEIDTVRHFIQDSIASAYAQYEQAETGAYRVFFEGTHDDIMFLAVSPGEREIGGVYEVRIAKNDKGDVTMSRQLHNRKLGSLSESTILLRKVTQLKFSYAGCASNSDEWSDVWEETDRLPYAVRTLVEFDSGISARWQPTQSFIVTSGC